MTKHLSNPCPYSTCGKQTVRADTLICDTCNRKAGRKVYHRAGNVPAFTLYPMGRKAQGGEKFMLSARVPVAYRGITSQDVILALDMARSAGIICNTERYNT